MRCSGSTARDVRCGHRLGRERHDAIEKGGESAPGCRVFVGTVEIGAGRAFNSRGYREWYASLKVEDPSVPAPVCANLIERDGQRMLIRSR